MRGHHNARWHDLHRISMLGGWWWVGGGRGGGRGRGRGVHGLKVEGGDVAGGGEGAGEVTAAAGEEGV